MRKQKSQFGIRPEEELDLQHQGSLGGDLLVSRYGRAVNEGDISSLKQGSNDDLTLGREPVEAPKVAMSSPSHERVERKTPERVATEGPERKGSPKKHNYK